MAEVLGNRTDRPETKADAPKDNTDQLRKMEKEALPPGHTNYSRYLERVPYFEEWNDSKQSVYIRCLQSCANSEKINGPGGAAAFCGVAYCIGDRIQSQADKIPDFLSYLRTKMPAAFSDLSEKAESGAFEPDDIQDVVGLLDGFNTTREAKQGATKDESKADNDKEVEHNKFESKLKELDQIILNSDKAKDKFKDVMATRGANFDDEKARRQFILDNRDIVKSEVGPLINTADKPKFDILMLSLGGIEGKSLDTHSTLENVSQRLRQDNNNAAELKSFVADNHKDIAVKGADDLDKDTQWALAEISFGKEQLEEKASGFINGVMQKDNAQRSPDTNAIIGGKSIDQLSDEDKRGILYSEGFYNAAMDGIKTGIQKYAAERVIDYNGKQARACIEAFQREGSTVDNVKFNGGNMSFDVSVKNGGMDYSQHGEFKDGKFLVTDLFDIGPDGIQRQPKELMSLASLDTLKGAAEIDLSAAKDLKSKADLKALIDDQVAGKLGKFENLQLGGHDILRAHSEHQAAKKGLSDLYQPKDELAALDGKGITKEAQPDAYRFLNVSLNTVNAGNVDIRAVANEQLRGFLGETHERSKVGTMKLLDDLGIVTLGAGNQQVFDVAKLQKINDALAYNDEQLTGQTIEQGLGVNLEKLGYSIKKSRFSEGTSDTIWLEKTS